MKNSILSAGSDFIRFLFSFFKVNFLFIVLIPIVLVSCQDKRQQVLKWTEYDPVYMSYEEFVSSVGLETSRHLNTPGKIYFYNGYLFINEINNGIHIFDNRNPSAPQNLGFLNIPANKDIAIRNGILYADSYTDLLVFDINDLQNIQLLERLKEVFDFRSPGYPYREVDPDKGIVVDWEAVEVEKVCEGECYPVRNNNNNIIFRSRDNMVLDASSGAETSFGGVAGVPSAGIGGSMARFTIASNYLYVVDDNNLIVFNISSTKPHEENNINLGWNIETIFPYKDKLFIGSQAAMYIYSISNPSHPVILSTYRHVNSCDPVVVEDDYAFVTLRMENSCPRGVNRLEVINVKDASNPKFVNSYEMINPHGLGIDNGKLFISEGDAGLKVMDALDPLDIKLLRHIKEITTYDIIPYQNVLMVTGKGGILQYNYADINNLVHLSTIPVYPK